MSCERRDVDGTHGTLADREWRLIREEPWNGPHNMALDEVAAETTGAGGPRTLRVYRWEPNTLSLGYHQDPATVDWGYCEREGVGIVRRPTGGGGIYHDATGDISYSIAAPADELPGPLLDCYHLLCEPLFDALDRLGIDAGFDADARPGLHDPACYLRALNPAHDVMVGGRKVSGNAQYRQRDAVVQHGSLTYTRETARHLAVFADPGVTPEAFDGRVTSVRAEASVDRETAVGALEDALGDWADTESGGWTDDELAAADTLARRKYASEAWTRRREDPTA